ncbi:MAG TPA: HD domain-containing protein [Candidatus Limiplasma sp.]|nr:HD domain-containing protein [Candidatus Limiplasma sp.]
MRILAKKLQENPKYKPILTDEMIDNLYKSAPLHDIGKIGIRDEVLLKTTKLTDEEFAEMQTHAQIGYDALRQASQKLGENSFLQNAMILSKYHHEKWNGKGYPDHIAGESIPLAGRIMAISDVYDALISQRVYKRAYTHEEAVKIIREESGKHFDPELVEAFLAVSDQFDEIARIFSDANEPFASN